MGSSRLPAGFLLCVAVLAMAVTESRSSSSPACSTVAGSYTSRAGTFCASDWPAGHNSAFRPDAEKSISEVPTIGACKTACDGLASCKAFSYRSRTEWCLLCTASTLTFQNQPQWESGDKIAMCKLFGDFGTCDECDSRSFQSCNSRGFEGNHGMDCEAYRRACQQHANNDGCGCGACDAATVAAVPCSEGLEWAKRDGECSGTRSSVPAADTLPACKAACLASASCKFVLFTAAAHRTSDGKGQCYLVDHDCPTSSGATFDHYKRCPVTPGASASASPHHCTSCLNSAGQMCAARLFNGNAGMNCDAYRTACANHADHPGGCGCGACADTAGTAPSPSPAPTPRPPSPAPTTATASGAINWCASGENPSSTDCVIKVKAFSRGWGDFDKIKYDPDFFNDVESCAKLQQADGTHMSSSWNTNPIAVSGGVVGGNFKYYVAYQTFAGGSPAITEGAVYRCVSSSGTSVKFAVQVAGSTPPPTPRPPSPAPTTGSAAPVPPPTAAPTSGPTPAPTLAPTKRTCARPVVKVSPGMANTAVALLPSQLQEGTESLSVAQCKAAVASCKTTCTPRFVNFERTEEAGHELVFHADVKRMVGCQPKTSVTDSSGHATVFCHYCCSWNKPWISTESMGACDWPEMMLLELFGSSSSSSSSSSSVSHVDDYLAARCWDDDALPGVLEWTGANVRLYENSVQDVANFAYAVPGGANAAMCSAMFDDAKAAAAAGTGWVPKVQSS